MRKHGENSDTGQYARLKSGHPDLRLKTNSAGKRINSAGHALLVGFQPKFGGSLKSTAR